MFDFYRRTYGYNLAEHENLQNPNCPFHFFYEDFRLCLRNNNVNYGAWHVYKPLFGSSVATCRLACSEISLPINENAREESGKWSDIVQLGRWRDSSTPCFVL